MTTAPDISAFPVALTDAGRRALRPGAVAFRIAELVALYFGVPFLVWLEVIPLGWVWVVLGSCAVYVIAMALTDRTFDRGSLWRWSGVGREYPRIMVTWMIACAAMAALTYGVDQQIIPLDTRQPRELLFDFPARAPAFWALVMVLYPIFSAYPQELIYRTYFFHRYERLLGGRWPAILASAAAFGWMHVLFQNWIAVALSAILGILLGITYSRTRSGAAAWMEHALYGNAAFTIGVGWFFFTGSVQS